MRTSLGSKLGRWFWYLLGYQTIEWHFDQPIVIQPGETKDITLMLEIVEDESGRERHRTADR